MDPNSHALSLVAASSQAVSIADNAALKPTGDFTMEAWIKNNGQTSRMIFQSYSQNANHAGIYMFISASGKLFVLSGKNTGTSAGVDFQSFQGTTTINDNQWHHVVFKWDAGTLYSYVDGVLEGSAGWVNAPGYAAANYIRIGCGNIAGTNYDFWDGQIDEVRFWSDARTTEEINQWMHEDVTGQSNLVAYWKFNNDLTSATGSHNGSAIGTPTYTTSTPFANYLSLDLTDKTANGNNLVNSGASVFTNTLPFANSDIAAQLNANHLRAPDSASLSITGNMTLELWVNFKALPTGSSAGFITKFNSSGNQRSFLFRMIDDSGTLKVDALFDQLGTAATYDNFRWNWTPSVNTWYHLALTFTPANPAASTFELFINGVSQGNGTNAGSTNVTGIFDSTAGVSIGSSDGGGANLLNGRVDDIRIWNVVRTPTEIANNRSVNLIGNESGLVAYWPLEELGIQYTKELTETLTLTSTILRNTGKRPTDTLTMTDTLTRVFTLLRSFTDTVSLTILFTIGYYMAKSFLESLTLIEKFYMHLNGSRLRWSRIVKPLAVTWTKIVKPDVESS